MQVKRWMWGNRGKERMMLEWIVEANSREDLINGNFFIRKELSRCRECKHWKQQTNYAGVPLSFGFCESDDMWRSLYGETYEVAHIDTEDDFYCGYAKRRE